jgi:catechol 2,3-dioxygenase-like lactoylglutathione lyase family enzyme
MSTRVTKIANVIIPTDDQDSALRFYTDVLGRRSTTAPAGSRSRPPTRTP